MQVGLSKINNLRFGGWCVMTTSELTELQKKHSGDSSWSEGRYRTDLASRVGYSRNDETFYNDHVGIFSLPEDRQVVIYNEPPHTNTNRHKQHMTRLKNHHRLRGNTPEHTQAFIDLLEKEGQPKSEVKKPKQRGTRRPRRVKKIKLDEQPVVRQSIQRELF